MRLVQEEATSEAAHKAGSATQSHDAETPLPATDIDKYIQSNEHAAISALKNYAIAQTMYSIWFKSDYTADFRLLRSAEREGEKIHLIAEGMSQARIGDGGISFHGYVFLEDSAITDWQDNCAVIAYPEKYGITGTATF